MEAARLEVALRFIQAIRRKDTDHRFSRSETPEVFPVRTRRKKPKKPWPIDTAGSTTTRRILCVWGTPVMISSTLESTREEALNLDTEEPILKELGVKTESYGYLLSEMMISGIGTVNGSFSSSSTSDSEDVNPFEKYDPKYLDDPELRTGRHCTMVALAGYYASLSHYVPAEQLKEELNCQFRLKHVHHIHPSMTLTKIRSLKGLLIDVALECDLELASVALAFVYLEKLILARLVERGNRKVASGCCLLLAVKAHDLKDVDYGKLMAVLGKQLGVSIVSLVRMEFPVFAGLRFDLHLPQSEYLPHLERILVDLPFSNLQEYLGERMYQHWKKTPKNINNI